MAKTDEYGIYSDDGKIMLEVTAKGKLVVAPSVEDLSPEGSAKLGRNQLNEIVFSEGCTKIGKGWDIDPMEVMDHPACLHEITLPSTIKEVAKGAFSEYECINNVWVPAGMKDYFLTILPEHLAKHVIEM
jgi:hypothetical protein